jgi:hypothetical protein
MSVACGGEGSSSDPGSAGQSGGSGATGGAPRQTGGRTEAVEGNGGASNLGGAPVPSGGSPEPVGGTGASSMGGASSGTGGQSAGGGDSPTGGTSTATGGLVSRDTGGAPHAGQATSIEGGGGATAGGWGGQGTSNPGGAAGGAGKTTDGGAGGSSALPSPWTSTSVGIQVTSRGGFGTLYWIYEATREQLTAEQLTALEGLELTSWPGPYASCDLPYFSVIIEDEDGSELRTAAIDPECRESPVITWQSFGAFYQTIDCERYAEPFSTTVGDADPVSPTRCMYRLRLGTDPERMALWMGMLVPGPGTCYADIADAELVATLYDSSATQALTTTTTPGTETVTRLSYDFTAAGTYHLLVESIGEDPTYGYVGFDCEE